VCPMTILGTFNYWEWGMALMFRN